MKQHAVSSAFWSLSDVIDRIATAANIVGTFVVLTLVAVVNLDVVSRGTLNMPFRGAVEVVQFSMVLIVFLQLPDVVRSGRLTRSDGFLFLAGSRWPWIERLMRRTIDMISGIVMLVIAIAIWPEFTEAWRTQNYFGIPGVFTAPWWPIKLTILASAMLCAVIFWLKTVRGDGDSADTSRRQSERRRE